MEKVKLSASKVLKRYICEFEFDISFTDRHILYCKMCEIKTHKCVISIYILKTKLIKTMF